MRIEINYHAETLQTAICEAIVTYLGYGMPAREIIDQLISRGFIRDPGNNAREDVVQRLADIAEQMRRGRVTQIPNNPSACTEPSGSAAPSTQALPAHGWFTEGLRKRAI
jgi:hypothetical protein